MYDFIPISDTIFRHMLEIFGSQKIGFVAECMKIFEDQNEEAECADAESDRGDHHLPPHRRRHLRQHREQGGDQAEGGSHQ